MADWFTDEGFWRRLYPILFSSERFEQADTEVDQVLELVGKRGGKALDLACGPGRHTVPLAKHGFDVTGVDLSEFLLAKARARAEQSKVAVEWVCRDMREFSRPGEFDLIVNLCTSFGYFSLLADDVKTLKNMVESLTDDGCVVIDLLGKEALAERLPTLQQPTQERDGALLIQRIKVIEDWSRVRSEWLLIRDDKVERFNFEHTLYSGRELRELMNWAGLSDVRLYGDLDGRPYGPGARHLVAVGRK